MRFTIGLGQALLVWAAVIAAAVAVRQQALLWALSAVAIVAVIILGQWHQRNARRDTAAGAFTGVVLWPVLIGLAIILINVISMTLSDFE
ncbi:hypothetical protein ACTI_09130 [Actinoplanes sp. OR16]|uniref:hypothetical protein n=1 Tax=Actinoplanes sp. OR16 TaxID=946334 RepID=UPI000F6FF403|nr:hypothetical protein [Actinoplanes sp. OR16]BBH64228.1 hypothetical protein ACTI_09130 [Actinoplanes sp. OR16]